MKEFENAIDLFYADTWRVPTTIEGLNALVTRPPGLRSWGGPYLNKPAIPLDPWNRAYRYRQLDDDTCEIRSLGRDGLVGGQEIDADILNEPSPSR